MKGIIFTEFLTMVEKEFSMDMVDTIIEKSNVSSKGAYTAVGTYSHQEMNSLVQALSAETNIKPENLLVAFGRYLFQTLSTAYPHFVNNAKDVLDFLSSIENYIHIEVRKLYPDAELPKFQSSYLSATKLELIYTSERHYGALAEGLILGALDFYHKEGNLEKEVLENKSVKFTISLNG